MYFKYCFNDFKSILFNVKLPLLCCTFSFAKNHLLFGVNFFSLKFGWCKENDIFHVCIRTSSASHMAAVSPSQSDHSCHFYIHLYLFLYYRCKFPNLCKSYVWVILLLIYCSCVFGIFNLKFIYFEIMQKK